MNRAYWETVAGDYNNAVLSVFDHDAGGLVCARIAAAADLEARAADLGCGVGKFTPALAAAFSHVEACDLTERGVAETRARCADCPNVTIRRVDLTSALLPFPPVAFALCINVLIMPALDARRRAWRTVTNQVGHGGLLLLVVPSLESALYGCFRQLEAQLDAGHGCAEALRQAARDEAAADLRQGVVALDGLRTKHYLREELEWLLPEHEFDPVELVKLEYAEPGSAPARDTLPAWDWLVVARRR